MYPAQSRDQWNLSQPDSCIHAANQVVTIVWSLTRQKHSILILRDWNILNLRRHPQQRGVFWESLYTDTFFKGLESNPCGMV